jgi:hypothetical protein
VIVHERMVLEWCKGTDMCAINGTDTVIKESKVWVILDYEGDRRVLSRELNLHGVEGW